MARLWIGREQTRRWSPAAVPAHWAGLDRRQFRKRRWHTKGRVNPNGGAGSAKDVLVVPGSAGRVPKDRVRGHGLLESEVGGCVIGWVAHRAGIRVVQPQERAVRTRQLLLGRPRSEAQDGVQVGPVTGHGYVEGSPSGCGARALCREWTAMLGLAWVANWYAVKAWASRRLRLTRWHERGPGEGLCGQCFTGGWAVGVITCLCVSLLVRAVMRGVARAGSRAVSAADPGVDHVGAVACREAFARRVAPVAVAGAGRFPSMSLRAWPVDDCWAIPGR